MNHDFLYFEHYLCQQMRRQLTLYARVSRDKLLNAFANIEEEAKEAADEIMNRPVGYDGGDYEAALERAYDTEIEVSLELQEVAEAMFAFITAGLYHLFEKQLTSFIRSELSDLERPPKLRTWNEIQKCLNAYGITFDDLPFCADLTELHLLANAVKHGDGSALKTLRDMDAAILHEPTGERNEGIGIGPYGSEYSIVAVPVFITVADFDRYLAAAKSFWDHERWQTVGERWHRNTPDIA